LIIVGVAALLIAMAGFGLRRALGLKVTGLEQSGLYRLSRNPQIVICTLAVIGYAILWPSWHTLGWLILYAVIAHMMVLTEEGHLRNVHGAAYVQYCERVPRYIWFRPGLR
jgi:protein-S-isoprenylcysteine O-methyltransferase Ste14